MFNNIFDFSYKRSFLEAIGFYIAYLVLLLLSAMIVGYMIDLIAIPENTYWIAHNIGNLEAIMLCLIISFIIVYKKNLYLKFWYILLALFSGILAVFGGGILGLLPTAYLTTCVHLSKPEDEIVNKKEFSYGQPVWHLVVLSVLTFGLYDLYWFYKNWKHLKLHKNLDVHPGWKTAGLFVPIYGLYLIYQQMQTIRDCAKEIGVEKLFSPGWLVFIYIVLNFTWRLPDQLWLFSLLSVIPLAIVQNTLNLYWQKEQPQKEIRKGFIGGEIVLMLIGVILLSLTTIGIFIPEENGFQTLNQSQTKNLHKNYLEKAEYEEILFYTLDSFGYEKKKLLPENVVSAYKNVVVFIKTYDKNNKPITTGSGFVINPNGFIITNAHVLSGAYSVVVTLPNKRIFRDVLLVENLFFPSIDMASIKTDASDLEFAFVGDSSQVYVGEEILAIGNPLGLRGTVSKGIISQHRNLDGMNLIQISAPISPGSSGGPIVNMYGEVVGITSSTLKDPDAQNLNFAIPINYIKAR